MPWTKYLRLGKRFFHAFTLAQLGLGNIMVTSPPQSLGEDSLAFDQPCWHPICTISIWLCSHSEPLVTQCTVSALNYSGILVKKIDEQDNKGLTQWQMMITNGHAFNLKGRLQEQQRGCEAGAVVDPARVPPHGLRGQAWMPGAHWGGYPGSANTRWPRECAGHVGWQVPTGPHSHLPLHPGCNYQHGRCGLPVLWPNPHQDPDRSGDKQGFCQGLVEEASPARTWTRPAWWWRAGHCWLSPAVPGLWARHVGWGLPCTDRVWWHVSQQPKQLLDGRPVCAWQYAAVLGPDDRQTATTWLTCPLGAWALWRPSHCPQPPHWWTTPSMTTCRWSTSTAWWPSSTMLGVWLAASGGFGEGTQGSQDPGQHLHQGQTLTPTHQFPSGLPEQHSPQQGQEALGGSFFQGLKVGRVLKFLWMVPLDLMYQHLQEMG